MSIDKIIEFNAEELDIILDMRYATKNNVTGKPFYNLSKYYLHEGAKNKFIESIRIAAAIGFKFKVFDAFRPIVAQQALWDFSPDPSFVSNPQTGGCPHCRGIAIDLTLVDLNGNELNMGTEFDDFTPLSHHANTDISEEAQLNRLLLMGIMTASGWDNYLNEWWHYQLFDSRSYPLIQDQETNSYLS